MTIKKRILTALAANGFGQIVTVGSQLVLIPLFLKYWGAAKYGEWLILWSIPAYLIMADLGIGSAAGNEMTIRAGAGDYKGAQQTFFGGLLVSVAAGLFVTVVGFIGAILIDKYEVLSTQHISPEESALVLLTLAFAAAIGFPGGAVSAAYRCCERNALGILLSNISRLLEAIVMGILLVMGRSALEICLGVLISKGVMLIIQTIFLRRICPWLFTPKCKPDKTIFKRLFIPSLGFMAFPLGNAISLQGPILIIGNLFDTTAVTTFVTMRTLARLPLQINNALNSSVWPEMSRVYGAGDMAMLRELHRRLWGITISLILMVAGIILINGSWITKLWLGNNGSYDSLLLNGIMSLTIISAIWNASAVVLVAINVHAKLGLTYVTVSGLSLCLAAVIAPYFGLSGLIVSILVGELLILIWVMLRVILVTEDRLNVFFIQSTYNVCREFLRFIKKIKCKK
jgi:O-antigen/teichoic acid export membrane protein